MMDPCCADEVAGVDVTSGRMSSNDLLSFVTSVGDGAAGFSSIRPRIRA